MRLWPRSLFGRTVWLILLVLLLSQAGTAVLLHYYFGKTRVRHLAELLAAQVQLATASLTSLEGGGRAAFVREMAAGHHPVRLLRADGAAPGNTPSRPFFRDLSRQLAAMLGYPTEVRLLPGGLWINIRAGGEAYWLMLPRRRMERLFPWQWAGIALLGGLLALGGAFLLVWRVNRPLRRLTEAASLIGRGRIPAPQEETGPAEIRTLSGAFNQMAQDLRHLDADRRLLLAGISHDLRTPLARLRLGVEMLDEGVDPALRQGMVQDMEDMDAVIAQFLAFVYDGGSEEPVAADLNAIVAGVCERYSLLGKPVPFHAASLPQFPLRPIAIQRLVTNLLDNALRHATRAVEVQTCCEDGGAVLRVLDRGPGVPEEEAERLLQPFTRLDASRGGAGSSGLGLAIVDRIARLHGGTVKLLRRSDGGLEARVVFPLDSTARGSSGCGRAGHAPS